ncbi:MAG: alpha-galactosidase [Victivallaceae bacterium]|nr:alpha-galactosidase [Victivallaceae bacterium]
MKKIQFEDCSACWENNFLLLENSKILRIINVENGFCVTKRLFFKETHTDWCIPFEYEHDFSYTALTEDYGCRPLQFNCRKIEGEIIRESLHWRNCLKLTMRLEEPVQGIELNREFFIFPETAVIASRLTIKSQVEPNHYNLIIKKVPGINPRPIENVVDSLRIKKKPYRVKCIEFFGRTDYTNRLTAELSLKWKNSKNIRHPLRGNILLIENQDDKSGVFFIQEAPPSSERRREGDADFILHGNTVKSCGWGILPHEFTTEAINSYIHVLGCFSDGVENACRTIKEYFMHGNPAQNMMIMANPWGAGGVRWYELIKESFITDELRACREIGIEHYQIDDGWQECRNLAELTLKNKPLGEKSWSIRKDIFKNGFSEIARIAKESGVGLCLWFAPSFNKRYRDWLEQAGILFALYKKYNIRIFKIDAIFIGSKEAETNLRNLLAELKERSHGDIYFNLDTTNGMRPGYFMFYEYGNIFLENRSNSKKHTRYLPWKTLANLWTLSRYLPAQRLQIEFPDIEKTRKAFYADTPAYPETFSQEYITAVSLFANPLFWGTPSECGAAAKIAIKKILDLHKKYRRAIFEGIIYPIGKKPDVHSWSGFQSHNHKMCSGFIIIYRGMNNQEQYCMKLKFLREVKIRFYCLSHEEKEREIFPDKSGGFLFSVPEQNSFRLYRYSAAGETNK